METDVLPFHKLILSNLPVVYQTTGRGEKDEPVVKGSPPAPTFETAWLTLRELLIDNEGFKDYPGGDAAIQREIKACQQRIQPKIDILIDKIHRSTTSLELEDSFFDILRVICGFSIPSLRTCNCVEEILIPKTFNSLLGVPVRIYVLPKENAVYQLVFNSFAVVLIMCFHELLINNQQCTPEFKRGVPRKVHLYLRVWGIVLDGFSP